MVTVVVPADGLYRIFRLAAEREGPAELRTNGNIFVDGNGHRSGQRPVMEFTIIVLIVVVTYIGPQIESNLVGHREGMADAQIDIPPLDRGNFLVDRDGWAEQSIIAQVDVELLRVRANQAIVNIAAAVAYFAVAVIVGKGQIRFIEVGLARNFPG